MFKRLMLLATVFLIGCASPTPDPPNIVFILADDLGYGDVGCYGQTQIQTPHIDQLAAEGMRFTQVYAGSTVCAPSRCALITGQHTGHCEIRGNLRVPLRPQDPSVAHVLKTAGYHTALFGKWGLGDEGSTGMPTRKGFDTFYGYLDQGHAHNSWPTFLISGEHRVHLKNVVPNETHERRGVASERVEFSNDLIHQEVLRCIDRQTPGRPFFIEAAYTLPHANNESQSIEIPDLGVYKNKDWPKAQKNYVAAITLLDRYVGQIMEQLQQRGLDQNTIVFFTSDNGPHQEGGNDPAFFNSSGPFRGIKRDLYEGGIRVPMIVRWPGRVRAGQASEQVWAFWDFLPTAAELSGASVPTGIDGISVVPTLLGKSSQTQHEYLYWEFHENGFKQAIRMGNWKAVRLGVNRPMELYDLAQDPSETINVAPSHHEVVQRIDALMTAARTDSVHWPVTP
jgi:arylsulfatase A-like enzyme